VIPQTISSIDSSFELSTSGEYLRRNPDSPAEESAWKAHHGAGPLSAPCVLRPGKAVRSASGTELKSTDLVWFHS
jgi:hypothetical protein